ncbi:DsrE family protein [Microbulbifer guangxiensis]|uniref:DsrE family protein n=1 Tax=Microbulbifer guangxiensis TaxID=2904249 RepID=UPI001F3F89CA|nr:DsrE family protein [Microbulbifer guangxiensis]
MKNAIAGSLGLFAAFAISANAAEFSTGPVIEGYGPVAAVEQIQPLTGKETFMVAFDATEAGGQEKANRKFESLARFLNMHVRAGVDPKQIKLALVVHGTAGFDLLNKAAYREKYDSANLNAPLIEKLTENNVRVILCGQSAAYHGIEAGDLLPNVEMALSAMTAHAQLQQQGYTVNPF